MCARRVARSLNGRRPAKALRESRTKPAAPPSPSEHVPDDATCIRHVATWWAESLTAWLLSSAIPPSQSALILALVIRGFLARHRRVNWIGPGWKQPGDLVLGRPNYWSHPDTVEWDRRLRLIRRAEFFADASRREAYRAPAPSNPVHTDATDSIEWHVSHINAPQILDLAEHAQRLLSARRWNEAETLVLKAEIEYRDANHHLARIGQRRIIDELLELRALEPLRRRLRDNVQRARQTRTAAADIRRRHVREEAEGLLESRPGLNGTDLARMLGRRFGDGPLKASTRTIRRDLLGIRRTQP